MEKLNITQLDGNLILHNGDYQYSNKPLKEWDCDNFVEYIKDYSNMDWNCSDNLLCYLYDIDYLNYIPSNYAPIYLYGVWQVLKEHIESNEKYVLSPRHRTLQKRRINKWNKQAEANRQEFLCRLKEIREESND
jgi:hypothetical protein